MAILQLLFELCDSAVLFIESCIDFDDQRDQVVGFHGLLREA